MLTLLPGVPLPPDACEVHVTPCLASFAFSSLRGQAYQALLINTGWEVPTQQQQQQQQQETSPKQQHGSDAVASTAVKGVPGWEQCSGPVLPGSSSSSDGLPAVVGHLAALPIPQLCPRGFVMIWANKEHLAGAMTLCKYVNYNQLLCVLYVRAVAVVMV
jgi:hypothetical protein